MLDNDSQKFAKSVIKNETAKINGTFLRIATNNRVLYSVAKTNKIIDIEKAGDLWISKLKETIKFTDQVLSGKVEYLITRTYKYIPYVTFDIDLYVDSKDYNQVIELFSKAGCQIKSHDGSFGGRIQNQQKNVIKENLLTIDLHRNFTWQKRKFLDTDLLFKNSRQRKIANQDSQIPSPEVEFLLCISDICHERFNITLLDIIWIEGLSGEITDWDLIFDQVSKYGWEKVFKATTKIINSITEELYNKTIIPNVGSSKSSSSLPMFLPLYICWLSYLENLLENHQFPLTSFAYMHYTRLRYFLSNKKRMPYYDDWIKV